MNSALSSLQVPGNEVLYSPPLSRNPADVHHRYLPGSCIFVPKILSPEHPSLCDDIEKSRTALNVSCCFITCKELKLAVVSFYKSPSTKYGVVLDDFCQVLFKHVNDMWSFFYGIILSCLNADVPIKRVYCKYSKCPTPWMTSEILATIHEKNKAKHMAECSGDSDDVLRYKRLKNR